MMPELAFYLKTEFIPLIQLLKFVGIAESGAQAQELVMNGEVFCNQIQEFRKRYKVRAGDVIECCDQTIRVYASQD